MNVRDALLASGNARVARRGSWPPGHRLRFRRDVRTALDYDDLVADDWEPVRPSPPGPPLRPEAAR